MTLLNKLILILFFMFAFAGASVALFAPDHGIFLQTGNGPIISSFICIFVGSVGLNAIIDLLDRFK